VQTSSDYCKLFLSSFDCPLLEVVKRCNLTHAICECKRDCPKEYALTHLLISLEFGDRVEPDEISDVGAFDLTISFFWKLALCLLNLAIGLSRLYVTSYTGILGNLFYNRIAAVIS
jgi:hypothetical protein